MENTIANRSPLATIISNIANSCDNIYIQHEISTLLNVFCDDQFFYDRKTNTRFGLTGFVKAEIILTTSSTETHEMTEGCFRAFETSQSVIVTPENMYHMVQYIANAIANPVKGYATYIHTGTIWTENANEWYSIEEASYPNDGQFYWRRFVRPTMPVG